MKLRHLYLALAVLGAVLPLSQFVPASLEGGFTMANVVTAVTSNRIAAGLAFDLLVAAVTGIVFIVSESTRRAVRYAWVAIVATVVVGFSLGLPLFLYLRER